MSFTSPNSRLLAPIFGDEAALHIFSDVQFARYMIRVEGALAQVQGDLGVIPKEDAARIARTITTFEPDFTQLQAAIGQAGVPVSELVRQLRHHVGGNAASWVHWGATTQDIVDTAAVLQFVDALALIETKHKQVITRLAQLADEHRYTVMVGRTHSQQALPITFGLKVAGWLAPLLRHQERLRQLKPRLMVVQFGGAAGTLAALGSRGLEVQSALAVSLSLHPPGVPWHTQRDIFTELAGWLSLLCGSLAKLAQDIILMAQTEIAEVRESANRARGGSSTMPQKSNPIASESIIAAARTNFGLLTNLQHAMLQEHERGTHGWQMEWLSLPQMFILTTAALNGAKFLSENLTVNEKAMRRHVEASKGLMMAEAISLALAERMGREKAKELVAQACNQAIQEEAHLIDVVRKKTDVSLDWGKLGEESNYLGATQALIDQVLNQVK